MLALLALLTTAAPHWSAALPWCNGGAFAACAGVTIESRRTASGTTFTFYIENSKGAQSIPGYLEIGAPEFIQQPPISTGVSYLGRVQEDLGGLSDDFWSWEDAGIGYYSFGGLGPLMLGCEPVPQNASYRRICPADGWDGTIAVNFETAYALDLPDIQVGHMDLCAVVSCTYSDGGSVSQTVTPEPATWALLAAGLAALTIVRRRK